MQRNTDFYWRYQRYAFVQDYFQQPFLAYPPLIILSYSSIIVRAYRKIKDKYGNQSNVNDCHTIIEETTCFLPLYSKITSSQYQ